MRALLLVSILILFAAAAPPGASAHVSKTSGPFRVEMGWSDEPPAAGVENSVEVEVFDVSGVPVDVHAGSLSVEVAYGATAVTLPLVPTARSRLLRADLIPTRPGVYAFHVTGTVRERTLDVMATCSETTFECVEEGSIPQFPVKEPSNGELAVRLGRESARAQNAEDAADSARTLAIVAIALAAGAVTLAVRVTRRSRRS